MTTTRLAIVATLMLMSAAAARAQVEGFNPASGDLRLAERPLSGRVLHVVAMREAPDRPGRPLPADPESGQRYYRDPAGNTVEISASGAGHRVMDKRGRTIWCRTIFTVGGPQGPTRESVTTADYTATGVLLRLRETGEGSEPLTVEAEIEPAPEGGHTARLEIPDRHGVTHFKTYVFNRDGLVIEFRRGGTHMHGEWITRFERNAHGDISAWGTPPVKDAWKYEYDYDSAGNWTRRTTFKRSGNGEWKQDRTVFRTITYAPPDAPLPPAPATRPVASLPRR